MSFSAVLSTPPRLLCVACASHVVTPPTRLCDACRRETIAEGSEASDGESEVLKAERRRYHEVDAQLRSISGSSSAMPLTSHRDSYVSGKEASTSHVIVRNDAVPDIPSVLSVPQSEGRQTPTAPVRHVTISESVDEFPQQAAAAAAADAPTNMSASCYEWQRYAAGLEAAVYSGQERIRSLELQNSILRITHSGATVRPFRVAAAAVLATHSVARLRHSAMSKWMAAVVRRHKPLRPTAVTGTVGPLIGGPVFTRRHSPNPPFASQQRKADRRIPPPRDETEMGYGDEPTRIIPEPLYMETPDSTSAADERATELRDLRKQVARLNLIVDDQRAVIGALQEVGSAYAPSTPPRDLSPERSVPWAEAWGDGSPSLARHGSATFPPNAAVISMPDEARDLPTPTRQSSNGPGSPSGTFFAGKRDESAMTALLQAELERFRVIALTHMADQEVRMRAAIEREAAMISTAIARDLRSYNAHTALWIGAETLLRQDAKTRLRAATLEAEERTEMIHLLLAETALLRAWAPKPHGSITRAPSADPPPPPADRSPTRAVALDPLISPRDERLTPSPRHFVTDRHALARLGAAAGTPSAIVTPPRRLSVHVPRSPPPVATAPPELDRGATASIVASQAQAAAKEVGKAEGRARQALVHRFFDEYEQLLDLFGDALRVLEEQQTAQLEAEAALLRIVDSGSGAAAVNNASFTSHFSTSTTEPVEYDVGPMPS
jgi:hypothetical protein